MSLRTADVVEPRNLHREPPITPARVLLRHFWTLPAIVVVFAAMAVAAAVSHGALLRVWDEPVRSWISAHRVDALDTFFLYVTRLGSWQVVVIGLVVLLAMAWRVCAPMASLLIVAVLARPLCEWVLKSSVGRVRPAEGALVSIGGPSFPSGHVLAAISLWGLVPPIVALVTHRRTLWWAATITSSAIIVLVAASRVYIGVHWLSDVVGALLFGAVYLLVIEQLADVSHRRHPCSVYFESPVPRRT
ncbi:MAG TPA: phosphatase PAP2 family protein [Acidimicrobiia bacterium]|nr:phosphatase PAP2 family protein [Acidimicrobiia bacterium]